MEDLSTSKPAQPSLASVNLDTLNKIEHYIKNFKGGDDLLNKYEIDRINKFAEQTNFKEEDLEVIQKDYAEAFEDLMESEK